VARGQSEPDRRLASRELTLALSKPLATRRRRRWLSMSWMKARRSGTWRCITR